MTGRELLTFSCCHWSNVLCHLKPTRVRIERYTKVMGKTTSMISYQIDGATAEDTEDIVYCWNFWVSLDHRGDRSPYQFSSNVRVFDSAINNYVPDEVLHEIVDMPTLNNLKSVTVQKRAVGENRLELLPKEQKQPLRKYYMVKTPDEYKLVSEDETQSISLKGKTPYDGVVKYYFNGDPPYYNKRKLIIEKLDRWIDGTTLPIEIKHFTNCETLIIRNNPDLKKLSSGLGGMSGLRTLIISNNKSLTELPDNIGNLQNLTTLEITNNEWFTKIPKEIKGLTNLEHLKISGNERLKGVPYALSYLKNLKTLHISNNQSLTDVELNFFKLSSLENLQITRNRKLKDLDLDGVDRSQTICTVAY